MSNNSPSLNTTRKLTGSFSSPEFNESLLSSAEGGVTSATSSVSNTNAAATTTAATITTSNSNSMIKSSTSAISATSATGIKLNTTRDSGFSDSLIEDSSSSSNSTQFLTRSEHIVNTTLLDSSKSPAKLKSVEEDMGSANAQDELSKEFITIVKTTKVTTKVKHIKNPKNKKNKKKKEAETVTEIVTENESTLSANLNGSNNQLVNGNIQASTISSRSVTHTTNPNDKQKVENTKIQEEEEAAEKASTHSSDSVNNEIYDEEDEEDNQLAELNGIKISSKKSKKRKDEIALIKVNINKSTEELVFQDFPPDSVVVTAAATSVKPDLKDSLATNTNTYSTATQHLSTTLSSDMNTSILDSEELLSDYSNSHNPIQPDTVKTGLPDLNASLTSSSIKELPNVVDFVLSDVTNEPLSIKAEKKKKKPFNLFTSKSKDSKRKLSKKDDLIQESPSKLAKTDTAIISKKQQQNKVNMKDILSFYDSTNQTKYRLLDDEQKDRIIYLKQECVDLLLNDFVQFEATSSSKTQLTNLKNQPVLDEIIRKMIARSLDLLRHDKIESFEKLAAQLKQEYKINDLNEDEIVDENYDFNNINSATNELIFIKLIQKALIDNKILLNLSLDKSKCRPYEEIIDFGPSTKSTSTPISRPVVIVKKQDVELEEVQVKQESFQIENGSKPAESISVEREDKIFEEPAVKAEENEVKPKLEEEGARIVLDTIKEPPIVFPSELDPSIKTAVVIEQSKDEVAQVPVPVPVENTAVSKKSNKKTKKNKKNSALSCIACGTSNMRKSEDDLKAMDLKTTEEPKEEAAQTIQSNQVVINPATEDLAKLHQTLFANLDAKPGDKPKVDEPVKQEQEVLNEPVIAIKEEEDKPQSLDVAVEVNVIKEKVPLETETDITTISPTPPCTPVDQNLLTLSSDKTSHPLIIEPPAIELKQSNFKEQKVKKSKKQKKEKIQVTNEIQLTSTGLVDVSVVDVRVETFIEPMPQKENVQTEIEQTQGVNINSLNSEVNTDELEKEPVRITIRNICMENEQNELERKSFSEVFEITQTIISRIEDNQLTVNGSNLDIKTEIDIGIEKEIFKEESKFEEKPEIKVEEIPVVNFEENSEKKVDEKPTATEVSVSFPKSDDIVKLPERDETIQEVLATSTVAEQKVESVPVIKETDKKKKVKKEKKTTTTCFSCKARKAKKSKDETAKPTLETHPPLAVAEEESKTLDSPKKANISDSPIDFSMFSGLDRRQSEKPSDAPTIYELNEKLSQKAELIEPEPIVIEKEVGIITPSLIGSTSIESSQQLESNNKIEISEIETEIKPTDTNFEVEKKQSEIKDLEAIEEKCKEDEKIEDDQIKKSKVLSDDIVVLPEPKVAVLHNQEVIKETPKIEVKNQVITPKVEKKIKKKKQVSCFQKAQKEKKTETVKGDFEKETLKTQEIKANTTDFHKDTVSVSAPKVIENWSVGLDRKEDEVVLRKDPVEFEAVTEEKIIQENITEVAPVKENVLDEKVIVDIILKPTEIEKEEPKLDIPEISLPQKDLVDGSWVIIDREPDHAYIPVVNNEKNVFSSAVTQQQDTKVETIVTDKKDIVIKDEKLKRKTNRIDLPLINCFGPSSDSKKKDKKIKSKKSNQKLKEEEKKEQVPVISSLEMPNIDIYPDTIDPSIESPKTDSVVKLDADAGVQVESKQNPILEDDANKEKDLQQVIKEEPKPEPDVVNESDSIIITETKPAPEEHLKLDDVIIESSTLSKEEIVIETKTEEPIVHIKLDREPDVVKLPERDEALVIASNNETIESESQAHKAEIQQAQSKIKSSKKKSEKKRTTSILDMPLIDIFISKREKTGKKPKKNQSKPEPVKEKIPELLIIDVPTLDIIQPERVPSLQPSPQPLSLSQKQEETHFDAKIPVVETSVDNFDIKINEHDVHHEPILTSETSKEPSKVDIEVLEKTVPFTENLQKIQLDKADDGAWIILDRQPDHAVIPDLTGQIQQSTVEKPAETSPTQIEAKLAPEMKPVQTKTIKSKKTVSCFSCKAKNKSKQQSQQQQPKAMVEPAKQETKKEIVQESKPLQTEITYDFSGLDRRDSEPLKQSEESKFSPKVEEASVKIDSEVFKTENIEQLIKEELEEVDKQYPELNKLPEIVEEHDVSKQKEIVPESTAEVIIENEEDEATKRLDDILEKAEIELKRLDESFDIKSKPLDQEIMHEEKPTATEVSVSFPKSDDIVKLPERDETIQEVLATSTVAEQKVESVPVIKETDKKKKVKKAKKTTTTCFSCKARKAKESKQILPANVEIAKTETNTETQISKPVDFVQTSTAYDANIFKGLDRPDESEPIKQPVIIDTIKEEPVNEQLKDLDQSQTIFDEVIQEIIIETSKLPEPEPEKTIELKEVEKTTETVEKIENITNISIDIPTTAEITSNLLPPSSSTPKKLSDDIVVLPEPPVRTDLTQTDVKEKETVTATVSQKTTEQVKQKKSNSLVSFLCGSKVKSSKPKDKPKSKPKQTDQKTILNEESTEQPPVIASSQEISPEALAPAQISVQPPKKPPRGYLDTTVQENDIDSLIPQNTLILISDSKPIETDTVSPQLDSSHVIIDPQVTKPLKIDVQTSKEQVNLSATSQTYNSSSAISTIKEQQILTTNVISSLLSTAESNFQTKSQHTIESSTLYERKTLEIPSVLEIDMSSNTSKRIITWDTDPLPHVQIGLHRVDFSESENFVQTSKPATPAVSPVTKPVEVASKLTESNITENDNVKKLTNEERKLLKVKQSETIEYLKQTAGYSTSSSSSKNEKENDKLAGKLFKKTIKILLKNESKSITYSKINKKLEKEVSVKKHSALIKNCGVQLKKEIESGSLFSYLKNDQITTQPQAPTVNLESENKKAALDFSNLDSNTSGTVKQKSSSVEHLDNNTEQQPGVMKRFPSLTWREANERARILFYKGRVPSIHYNEKRDSFRVSMLTSVSTNGTEKTTEVPVCDDDVRRLLNSCGLYWNGESISLLNKSDDIFSIAQQEAFDILQLINSNNKTNN